MMVYGDSHLLLLCLCTLSYCTNASTDVSIAIANNQQRAPVGWDSTPLNGSIIYIWYREMWYDKLSLDDEFCLIIIPIMAVCHSDRCGCMGICAGDLSSIVRKRWICELTFVRRIKQHAATIGSRIQCSQNQSHILILPGCERILL